MPAQRMSRIAPLLVVLGTLCLIASRAQAGGLEYTGQGAQSLGRGGAVTARADDPMVLSYNPAGLVELRGSQLLFNLNLAYMDACVDPAGYYGWGVYGGGAAGTPTELIDPETGEAETIPLGDLATADDGTSYAVAADYYIDPYDTVCMDQQVVPVPQLAWTYRLSEDFGIGFGFLFPSVMPSGRWGGDNGVIRGDDGRLRPTPTRYMMLRSSNIGMFPTVGAAYRIMDELRVGLAFEWGVIAVTNFTMASAVAGTTPANDIVAKVKAQDFFVPALTASVHAVPIDAIDIVVAFRWQDDLKADGDIDLTTGLYNGTQRPYINEHIRITSLYQGMPWKLRGGIRYADRLAPRPVGDGHGEADAASPDRVHDPLQDERWDVELDVEYQANSANDAQVLKYEPGNLVEFRLLDPTSMAPPIEFPTPPPGNPDTVIRKEWKDQISVRLGGTLNLMPGRLAVSGGAHFETRGVDPNFMQIDVWPVQRFGLHAGVMVRLAKSVDLVLSYAHIFQETIVVAPPQHQDAATIYDCYSPGPMGTTMPEACQAPPGELATIDKTVGVPVDRAGNGTQVLEEQSQGSADGTAGLAQNAPRILAGQPPYIVNAGRYRSGMDVFAAGFNYHF